MKKLIREIEVRDGFSIRNYDERTLWQPIQELLFNNMSAENVDADFHILENSIADWNAQVVKERDLTPMIQCRSREEFFELNWNKNIGYGNKVLAKVERSSENVTLIKVDTVPLINISLSSYVVRINYYECEV